MAISFQLHSFSRNAALCCMELPFKWSDFYLLPHS
uniref:Uncharacterized protein n=1 Tax=Rhizophora mucronata TaxID=61149 RepID=A0A2P2J1U5_RHIMU